MLTADTDAPIHRDRGGHWVALICLAALLPWAWAQYHQAINFDIVWLAEAFQRLLRGYSMTAYAYETNPPLSLLTYAPAVLVTKLTHVPLPCTVFFYCLGLVALSTAALAGILRGWTFLTEANVLGLIVGYLTVNTVLAALSFGERDQLVGLALVPFVAAQISLTRGYRLPHRLGWAIFLTGALFILIKPHHGLLPTIILLYRMASQRRWTVLRDEDFISLAAMTTGYAALVFFMFSDYVHVIFPDVVHYYLTINDGTVIRKTLTMAGLYGGSAGVAWVLLGASPLRTTVLLLLGAAFVSLVPYYVQGFGFYYHLLPSLSFAGCAMGLMLQRLGELELKKPFMAALASGILCIGTAYIAMPPPWHPAPPASYADTALFRLVKQCAGPPPCRFFMFDKDMDVVHDLAYYAHTEHASRFVSLWFLPALLAQGDAVQPARDRFSTLMAEDFDRLKPQTALIAPVEVEKGKPFDFVGYFSRNRRFASAWSHYRKTGTVDFDPHIFFPPMQQGAFIRHYDVYTRTEL